MAGMDELNTVVAKVGGWRSIGFALAVSVVLVILKRLLSSPSEPKAAPKRWVVCACGWGGEVTQRKPRCPKCGRTELQDA
jgi:hypothetical protein